MRQEMLNLCGSFPEVEWLREFDIVMAWLAEMRCGELRHLLR